MEIMTLQAQGFAQSIKNKLNMSARDSSFMNMVSFLAKWLFQSIMAFIISKIHAFIQYSKIHAKIGTQC